MMKKPFNDDPELQLQEYEWQVDAIADRRIEWMTTSMAEEQSVDIEDGTPEYRH